MAKATILDRLAGAMKTLGKREGKALTPRQRVAAAQRWNSLAGIADNRLAHMDALSEDIPEIMKDYNREAYAYDAMKLLREEGNAYDNPFLSDNIDKYAEQSEFLDWCRYNGLEPNGRNLKTFRWERYKGMSVPQRERIYDNYDPYFLPEEKMWYSRSDMPDYLPVGWSDVE